MIKHKRMENLFYKNEETGYRYLGALESCYTLYDFTAKNPDEDSIYYSFIANILRKDEFENLVDKTKDCVECEHYSKCERKDNVLDDRKHCKERIFFDLEKDINQKIVFYDEQLNSAVVFSVDGDICCEARGFETINELLDDIYDGVNSPYSDDLIEYFDEIGEGLKLKDNLMYIRYINAEGYVDNNVITSFRSLKDKKIHTIMDIICLLNEGEEA